MNDRAQLTAEDVAVFHDMSGELFATFTNRRLSWWNERFSESIGYSHDELLSIAVPVDPTDIEGMATIRRILTQGGSVPPTETRFVRADGTISTWEWSAQAVGDAVHLAARDISQRRQHQADLKRGQALLRSIVDSSPTVIFAKDLEGKYVLVNRTFTEGAGIPEAQLLGRTMNEVWTDATPEEIEQVRRLEQAVIESGEPVVSDDSVMGRTILTTRFPLRDANGDIVGTGAVGMDISDRTQAEKELRERERLLDTIVRACPDVVSVLDANGQMVAVSDAAWAILGYPPSTDLSLLPDLIHPEERGEVFERHARLIAGETDRLEMRYRARHAKGHWITYDTRARLIRADDGSPQGIVVISRDITGELEAEEQLYLAVQAAERASEAKSEFLSRMSHELRTPLNSVLGFAQLLFMDDLPPPQHDAVGHILRAGRHLLDLIDEVLDIARIETGRLQIDLAPVAVDPVVADALYITAPLAERNGISVGVAGTSGAWVRSDRQRLLQVLLNLLSNAVKYNRPGGRADVLISTAPVGSGGEDHLDPTRALAEVAIEVRDTGVGIPPENIHRLFDPFDRLGAEDTGVEGTGVGLTLTKQLIDRMGGSIEVKSCAEGSSFIVRLPSCEPAEVLEPQAPQHSPSSAHNVRLLHVEDNLANLELVEQLLARRGGVELLAAMHGSLAVELAREHLPDLILLDVHLPDLQGDEVLRILRADPATAGIPVIVVSADTTVMQRFEGMGVSAYLAKPIDVHQLLNLVDSLA